MAHCDDTDYALSYKEYDSKYIAVYGDKETYNDLIKKLSGKWNSRLQMWLVPIINTQSISDLVLAANRVKKLEEIEHHAKSRKSQHKYHRELSGDEESTDSEHNSPSPSSKLLENMYTSAVSITKEREKRLFENEKKKYMGDENNNNKKSHSDRSKTNSKQPSLQELLLSNQYKETAAATLSHDNDDGNTSFTMSSPSQSPSNDNDKYSKLLSEVDNLKKRIYKLSCKKDK